ncbi:U4/U6 small nuclear ribonucleoprotein, putative [Eimeria brunetti]|uniref:U4/U6 small nuclear ribonucleoprotein, putative n=1 Tax=Eimeria brunetti TaxID=51314 RepID=U6LVZ3_9EIME|nr:U4/U6 small nuclear ribonucleoprotein, putative [Eimeria brunetti]
MFKVDTNAKQFHVTGVCVIPPQPAWCVVVFEGSHKSIKRLRALMERRIKWTDTDLGAKEAQEDSDEEDDTAPPTNEECCLCWQEHYWETAQKFRDARLDY